MAQFPSLARTSSMNAAACLAGSAPTVSVSPNSVASSASGITNVRVADWVNLTPWNLPVKAAFSQRVAARLVDGISGSVPAHGWLTPETGGRSTSLSRAAGMPNRTGVVNASFGRSVAQPPPSSRPHRPSTAAASIRPEAPTSGASAVATRSTVDVVNSPVRATPTTYVVTGRFHERSTSWIAWSPACSTVRVAISCTRLSAHPANQPTSVR